MIEVEADRPADEMDAALARVIYDALANASGDDAWMGDFEIGVWDDGGDVVARKVSLDGQFDMLFAARFVARFLAQKV